MTAEKYDFSFERTCKFRAGVQDALSAYKEQCDRKVCQAKQSSTLSYSSLSQQPEQTTELSLGHQGRQPQKMLTAAGNLVTNFLWLTPLLSTSCGDLSGSSDIDSLVQLYRNVFVWFPIDRHLSCFRYFALIIIVADKYPCTCLLKYLLKCCFRKKSQKW